MDWEKYAKSLEDIISRIDLPDATRILVDALVEESKANCNVSSKSSC